MKKNKQDWVLGLFVTAIFFLLVLIYDRVSVVNSLSGWIIFPLAFVILTFSIKLIKLVFKIK